MYLLVDEDSFLLEPSMLLSISHITISLLMPKKGHHLVLFMEFFTSFKRQRVFRLSNCDVMNCELMKVRMFWTWVSLCLFVIDLDSQISYPFTLRSTSSQYFFFSALIRRVHQIMNSKRPPIDNLSIKHIQTPHSKHPPSSLKIVDPRWSKEAHTQIHKNPIKCANLYPRKHFSAAPTQPSQC